MHNSRTVGVVALVRQFGKKAVHRGNKAFDIHENSYRVDADVVPLFIHRRYTTDGWYQCGVQLQPDKGGRIVTMGAPADDAHWPKQQYENGVDKNTERQAEPTRAWFDTEAKLRKDGRRRHCRRNLVALSNAWWNALNPLRAPHSGTRGGHTGRTSISLVEHQDRRITDWGEVSNSSKVPF